MSDLAVIGVYLLGFAIVAALMAAIVGHANWQARRENAEFDKMLHDLMGAHR